MSRIPATLVLEDGTTFDGIAIGNTDRCLGELIFNTSMSGYQEILSDPSYCGQLVCFTAPHVGNYGVTEIDAQCAQPVAAGLVVRELCEVPSNWRAQQSLPDWLVERGMGGISEVDTRALTRHLRTRGAMRAGIFCGDGSPEQWLARVRGIPTMEGCNLAQSVSCTAPTIHQAQGNQRGRLALVDFGVKAGIVRELTKRGFEVHVHPWNSSVDSLGDFDGVVLSNGPGDPAVVQEGIAIAKDLIGTTPILGICLGYQLAGLALGGRSYKLRFGHHGGNHPVRDIRSGELWITAQNHGFAIDPESLPDDVTITHVSLYDGTLEGFASPSKHLLAVQFHPEAAPGPSDAAPIFDRFVEMVEAYA